MSTKITLQAGTVAKYDAITSNNAGRIYLATDGTSKGYLYYDNGTNKLNIVPRKLEIVNGGTGMTTNPSMLINLASNSAAKVFAAAPRPGVTGILPVAHGGTGAGSFNSLGVLYGNGTGAIKATAKGSQGQILTANGSGTPIWGNPSLTWSGQTLSLSLASKTMTSVTLPIATTSVYGIVSTTAQSFAGNKTFANNVTVSQNLSVAGATMSYSSTTNTLTIAFDS